jgi:small subunit ribosomal protein S13
MARIAGALVPSNKRIEVALTYIYGIGLTTSKKILKATQIDFNTRTKDLSEDELKRLRLAVETDRKVEGDLRREVMSGIKRLKDIKSYRGDRHEKNLPVRGQRTKTNSRTVRGNKKGSGSSGKVKIAKK